MNQHTWIEAEKFNFIAADFGEYNSEILLRFKVEDKLCHR